MTLERAPEADQEVGAEEMALMLAVPNRRDPAAITDPIATFCTDAPELERPVTAFGLALAA
jgi:hypothetical protein